ncbi:Crp/Fnr family transcriptional regulator [Vibrio gigantis]|uniref:Crp/Fnr family transcriptional regulator n=1 Tax=Vibrio gigantis TaxID=296199 RepID=UPI002FC6FB32
MQYIQTLQQNWGISEELANTLLETGVIRSVAKDTMIALQGDVSHSLLFPLNGVVGLYRDTFEGKQQFSGLFSVGNIINDMYLFEKNGSHRTYLKSLEPCTALKISFNDAKKLLAKNIEFTNLIARSLGNKSRAGSLIIYIIHEKDTLLKTANAIRFVHEVCNLLEMPMTIEQLASFLSMSRNTVGNAMKKLKNMDIIDNKNGCIIIKNKQELINLCQSQM